MMQAEGDKRPIERVGLERQLIGLTGALQIAWNRLLMVMADVKHRLGLVDADDFPPLICLDSGRATRPVPVATSSTNSSPLSVSISINLSVREARIPDNPRRSKSAACAGS